MLEGVKKAFTCALAPKAARARAARKSFMVIVLVGMLKGKGWIDSGGKKSFGWTERMKD